MILDINLTVVIEIDSLQQKTKYVCVGSVFVFYMFNPL